MANLLTDLGDALKATIVAASARFTPVGNTGGTLHVEVVKGNAPLTYPAGAAGRCLIRHAGTETTLRHDESAASSFTFLLMFDLVDVAASGAHRHVIQQAVVGTFADRGTEFWASFTDNGSNRLGSSGAVTVGSIYEDVETDPDRPTVIAEISISLWHKVPLA